MIAALCYLHAWPQTQPLVRVKGRIADKESQLPLPDATVALLHAKDSSMAASAFAGKKGEFILNGVLPGSYHLYITFLGYQPVLRPLQVTLTDTLIDLGLIPIQGTGVNLKTVEIVQIRSPMVVKKDTLEFNADFYKTRENAVMEELLKKLPGVQVERNGTIKVNGETVKKVLVNGKPFFGDDPKLATRNLPAEMIEKVQLIDRKSDMAQFTGVEDGKREKAINITVKESSKNTYFGRAAAGYGTDERFAASGNLNRFSNEGQVSFLGSANNVNSAGFLGDDGQGIVSGENGITRNWNAGINYSRELAKKLKISGSYVFNNNQTESKIMSARQNFLPDTTFYYNQDTRSQDRNRSHALNFQMEYRPDTMYFLSMQGNLHYSITSRLYSNIYESLGNTMQLVNNGTIQNTSENTAPNLGAAISLGRRFRKPGRVLSVGLNFGYDSGDQDNVNQSNNTFIQPNGEVYSDTVNQYNKIGSSHKMFQVTLIYAEPVFKDRYLEFTYSYSRDKTISDKFTYDYNVLKGEYDCLNDSLSNSFENISVLHAASISLRTQKKKYDYSIGVNMLSAKLVNSNISQHDLSQNHTLSFYPSAVFNYAFSKRSRLRLNYTGMPQQPNVTQLQPIPDNSNPLYVSLGNPDLKVAFTHNVIIGYNTFNPITFRAVGVSANVSVTTNKIVNANWFDSLGRQLSQPQNANGAYSIKFNIVNTIPLKKWKTALNSSTGFLVNRDISYVNGVKGSNRNFGVFQGLSLDYTYRELFNVATAASATYNGMRYAVQKENNANSFNYSFSLSSNVNFPLGFTAGGNLIYTLGTGRAVGYNQGVTIFNAFVSKTVLRNNRGLIKLQGVDLLNRNQSLRRTIGDSYVEDTQTTVLQRFFILSFFYFLKPASGN